MKTEKQRDMNKVYPMAACWLPGIIAAGATTAGGAVVQIPFANNFVTSISTVNFSSDFTGDGINELGGSTNFRFPIVPLFSPNSNIGIGLSSEGLFAFANQYADGRFAARAGNVGSVISNAGATSIGFKRIDFSDARINGGVRTFGHLQLTAVADPSGFSIRVNRLVFDDADPLAFQLPQNTPDLGVEYPIWSGVPEPSSLGLLALGAGGLLTRRRRAKSAA